MKRALVDPQRHVRLWISYDGLPEKQRARLIRLRAMNPLSTITLFVERRHIVAPSLAQLERFADAVTMDLVDVSAIPVFGESERVIKSHVLKEIELFFAHRGGDASLQGNLSVVADQVRLLSWVACHGMFADLDVEFRDPFPTRPIAAPYGVLARYEMVNSELSAFKKINWRYLVADEAAIVTFGGSREREGNQAVFARDRAV